MMDKKDEMILDLLHTDASLSTYQISKKTAIPQTTVLNRIRKLKEEGIIKRYTVNTDYKKLGKKVKALIYAKVEKNSEHKKKISGEVEELLFRHDFVVNVKRLMGKYDFVLEVVSKDIDELNDFLVKKVRAYEFIAETETVVVLKEWDK